MSLWEYLRMYIRRSLDRPKRVLCGCPPFPPGETKTNRPKRLEDHPKTGVILRVIYLVPGIRYVM